ncbi:MAG TPA: gluconate:H+ symporter [Vicinamibacterales bacterium]|nr:gluconate:H+ symporter [Vicinamibacterales bacterium]
MTPAPDQALLLWTAAAVVALILLIAWARLNAFVALTVTSLVVGAVSGMPLGTVVRAFQEGVGSTLGFIAVVIGLGTMVGKMLAESGGADVVADRLIRLFGVRHVHWTIALVAFVVGLPVFFSVGLVLVAPIVFTLARRERLPLLLVGLPLVAGLSASHGLVPPHPGPLAAIERLHADMGGTIVWSLAIGLPAALIVGPPLGWFVGQRLAVAPGALATELSAREEGRPRPGFGVTLFAILLPIVLMLGATAAAVVWPDGGRLRAAAEFAGSPIVAMTLAVLVSFHVFGLACGLDRKAILRFSEECLGPVASVLLVVGAGGGFGRVLDAAGVGTALHDVASGLRLSPLLLGWVIAALLRIAVGSATVAIVTAAGIMAPVAAAMPGTNRELLVLALGAGSIVASHVNDGGFWLVKEYFNLTVVQTLATWTVLETAFSIVALCLVLAASLVI